jgi:hypothetical protein
MVLALFADYQKSSHAFPDKIPADSCPSLIGSFSRAGRKFLSTEARTAGDPNPIPNILL